MAFFISVSSLIACFFFASNSPAEKNARLKAPVCVGFTPKAASPEASRYFSVISYLAGGARELQLSTGRTAWETTFAALDGSEATVIVRSRHGGMRQIVSGQIVPLELEMVVVDAERRQAGAALPLARPAGDPNGRFFSGRSSDGFTIGKVEMILKGDVALLRFTRE